MSDPTSTVTAMTPITAAVVAFEARRWNHGGAKAQAIHDVFGMSPHSYYAAVNRVIEDPEALALDPVTVNRLRRLRDSRRRARSA